MRIVRVAAWIVAATLALVVAASFHPMVRNVYRAIRPSTGYDLQVPAMPGLPAPAVLVFSKTNGFRHFEAIEAGGAALREIAANHGWSVFHTENSAVFAPGTLAMFKVVVWHNASGAPLSRAQRGALREWIEAGGGFVGIHAALDDSHASWPWYAANVVGARFIGHPLPHQRATIRVESGDHPVMHGTEPAWSHFDEWYSFERSVRGDEGVEVLASVDEADYDQRLKLLWIDRDLSMGDHPVMWTRRVGDGRAFLSALGHRSEVYRDANYRAVLKGAIEWTGQLTSENPN